MANKAFQGLFSPVEVVSTNNLLRIEQNQCKLQMSRLYYSSLFKLFYFFLIFTSILCIVLAVFHLYKYSLYLLVIEALLTTMLLFETIFRAFMQGCELYLCQIWNIVDVVVIFFSVIFMWIGYEIGGGIGEIDEVSAIFVIITRTLIQFVRLASVIKKKQEQEVQVIDLNDLSEVPDLPKLKDNKHLNTESVVKFEKQKNEYQDSEAHES